MLLSDLHKRATDEHGSDSVPVVVLVDGKMYHASLIGFLSPKGGHQKVAMLAPTLEVEEPRMGCDLLHARWMG